MSAILSNKPTRYRLRPEALDDLDDIWRYTAETWSLAQADRYIDQLVTTFEALVNLPGVAREYVEFTPPIRIQVHQSHLIVYRVDNSMIDIIRVLGGRQNWKRILSALDR